jgi:hypothetical protein
MRIAFSRSLKGVRMPNLRTKKSRDNKQRVTSFARAKFIPPSTGEKMFLLILNREERRSNILGDLAEEYCQLAERLGERFARLWYYKQAVASLWPLMRSAAKWSLLAWAGELIRRLIH